MGRRRRDRTGDGLPGQRRRDIGLFVLGDCSTAQAPNTAELGDHDVKDQNAVLLGKMRLASTTT